MMGKGIYVRQAGVAVYIHAAWATWDRLPLLVGEVERAAHRALAAKCHELGAEVVALGGVEDHVHLLVKLPATLPLASLIGQIKGASSHLVTHLPDDGDRLFKWQGSYGAVSVSPQALEEVADYIAHQRAHHAACTLIAEWEPPTPHNP
jgi:REP element-mobilizing transposase RayT